MQLMMYAGPSSNSEFPLGMWLLPGENGWYGSRDFQGLDEERLGRNHPMVMVNCDEGKINRTLYTIYPGFDGFPAKTQIHWWYTYQVNGKTYNLGKVFADAFSEVAVQLAPYLLRYQKVVTEQLETMRLSEVRDQAWARLNDLPRQQKVWETICLPDEQVLELIKLTDLFRENDPAKPQGLLLKGVPGTGKTLLASKIADALGCNFLTASLADLKHHHLGKSGQNVRELWTRARENAPSVVFVDECESVFGKRGAADTDVVATDVVQAFLAEWNGKDKDVWLIAATNRRDMMDEAIVSRFDHEMEVCAPTEDLRLRILQVEMKELGWNGIVPVDMGKLTQGMSGRDLAQLAKKVRASAHPRAPEREDFLSAVSRARNTGNTPVDGRASWKRLILPANKIEELQLLCAVLSDPEGWQKQGVTIPDGLLLFGPPGCGKTEIARTIANESGLTFIAMTTGETKGKFIGHSASNVKTAFERARASAPAIMFLDELDIIAPARNKGMSDTFQEEIVGQLLQEIDGIRRKESYIFLLGATNHVGRVDPAILSRMQQTIEIPLPDSECRRRYWEMILGTKKRSFQLDDVCSTLAERSEGLSNRDINNRIARAEQKAIRRALSLGGPQHFSLILEDFAQEQVCPATAG